MTLGDRLRRVAGAVEPRMLTALLAIAAFAWTFVQLADEVTEGETRDLDTRILLAFRSAADPADPLGPGWLEEFVRDVTALGSVGVLTFVTVAAAGYMLLYGKRRSTVLLLVAVVGGQLLSTVFKLGFDRARPDLVPHGAAVYTASFPSGHAMMAAVTYLTLGAMLARVQPSRALKVYVLCLAVLVTVAVGVSRLYLGVHWPTDVLAGWTAGAAWALVCWSIARWLAERGAVEAGAADTGAPRKN